MWYAILLMTTDRMEEALREIKRAQELDPLSLVINTTGAWVLARAGQSDRAIEQLRKTLEMDQSFALAYYRLAQTYLETGMYAEAIPELRKAIALSGESPRAMAELGLAYARSGNRGEAQKLLSELKERSKQRYVSPFDFALIHGGLGDKDQALQWLERAYQERSVSLYRLKSSPAFEGLRSDQRFQDLVRRIGLPP
jgi:tetratricopeptide (TPR) repeat protein